LGISVGFYGFYPVGRSKDTPFFGPRNRKAILGLFLPLFPEIAYIAMTPEPLWLWGPACPNRPQAHRKTSLSPS